MKNIRLFFLAIVLVTLLIVGCNLEAQPTIRSVSAETHETLTSTATVKPTATFLPTFTSVPLNIQMTMYSISTRTFTPIPKDIFDNFQGLAGNCRTADGLESLMEASFGLDGEVLIRSRADVNISFDKAEYISGDAARLSVRANDSLDYSKFMTEIEVMSVIESPTLKRYSFYLFDNGTHGDEKANDGIYANIFNETKDTGIYKIYFHFSGRNESTGEILDKECFLAKTILPVLSPATSQGGENAACGKLEATNPVIVRNQMEGGNDSTELSWWASHPKAISLGNRIIAIWKVGYDGQKPKPNVYMRLLDNKLMPVGDVKLLFERNIVGHTTLIRKENNALFSYCGRYYVDGIAQDRSTSALLDSMGNLIYEKVHSPTNMHCGTGPISVWTGTRLLFFSWSNVFGVADTYLDVADADGNSIIWKTVPGVGLPSVAGENVLTSSTRNWGNTLIIHQLDLEGNELGELITLDALTYEVDGRIVVGNFRGTYIVPTSDGWMIIASLYAPGIYIAHLDRNGSLVSDPAIVAKDLYFENGLEDVIAYNGGAAILGDSFPFGYSSKLGLIALLISENGTVQPWYPKEGEAPIFGSFFEHQDRLFLIYQSKSTTDKPQTNQILVRELQCIP